MTANLEVVRSLYAAFAAGDVPAFLAQLAPDLIWCEAEGFPLADRNPYRGPEAVLHGVFGRVAGFWSEFRVVEPEFHGSGDVVVVLGRYHGVVAKSGRPMDVQIAHTWWLRDGKVVRFQQMCDTAAVAAALA